MGRTRSPDSVYDSVAYDPVKTRLTESEAEAKELTNRTLSLVYSSASASASDNAVFTLIVSDGVINKISVALPAPSI